MRILFSAFLLLAWSMHAVAQPGSEDHCQLTQPPQGSGEFVASDLEGRVFPRLDAIGRQYSGCQVAWTEGVDGWQVVARVYFLRGEPVALSLPQVGPEAGGATCTYRNQTLVSGPSDLCFPYPRLRMKSMPPGCAANVLKGLNPAGPCEMDGALRLESVLTSPPSMSAPISPADKLYWPLNS